MPAFCDTPIMSHLHFEFCFLSFSISRLQIDGEQFFIRDKVMVAQMRRCNNSLISIEFVTFVFTCSLLFFFPLPSLCITVHMIEDINEKGKRDFVNINLLCIKSAPNSKSSCMIKRRGTQTL
ncbi:hypothetical protein ACOSQ2_015542 [Xanthoceras sorbifolium]